MVVGGGVAGAVLDTSYNQVNQESRGAYFFILDYVRL